MKNGDKILVNDELYYIEYFDSGLVMVFMKDKLRFINRKNVKFSKELEIYRTWFIDWRG